MNRIETNTPEHNTAAFGNSVLDEFLARYEAAEDRQAALDDFCGRHPERAERFRALAAQSDRMRAVAGAAMERLKPGQTLGPFCIERELASGGMGVIYEARQVGLERRVALKTIRSDRASESVRERFVREQQALAQLHHTHIVPIYAAGVEGKLHFYGMQFIQGVTLHKLILTLQCGAIGGWEEISALLQQLSEDGGKSRPAPLQAMAGGTPTPRAKFPPSYFRFAADLIAQAAEAVQSAHERQVIHRDLKPANLMLDEAGKCWLIDFGLARVPGTTMTGSGNALDAECAAMTQHALGTQPYMSPEHFALSADERSDVWKPKLAIRNCH